VVSVKSATEAELIKLLENTFRTVSTSLINELVQIAYELDVNMWNATKTAGSNSRCSTQVPASVGTSS